MNSAARRAKCLPCPPNRPPRAGRQSPDQGRRPPDPGRRLRLHLPRLPRAAAADAQVRRTADERRARLLQHGLEDDAGRADAASPATSRRTSPSSSTIRPRRFAARSIADYKAHRPDPPSDLIPQFGLIRQATRAFNLACLEQEGWEADDLIATYAKQASEARRLRHHRLLRQGPDAARAARRARWSTR